MSEFNKPLPVRYLVDSHHGVYCWKVLYNTFHSSLRTREGKPLPQEWKDVLASDPDEPDYWDGINDIESQGLCIVDINGALWTVYQEEDIVAVHPDAVYNEDKDCWEMPDGV